MTSDAAHAEQAPASRYDVRPYRPDGGAEAPGILMLFSALAIVGAILGFLAHWISNYFYLILIFPVLIGLALGYVGARMVKQGRVRNPIIGGLAGFLGGALAMFMMHYFDYQSFRQDIDENLHPSYIELAQAPPQEQAEVLDNVPAEEREELQLVLRVAGVRSFWDYMDFSAEQGVRIGRATGGSSDGGLNLGYTGSWIYWIVEMFVVAGITFAMVKGATAEPYCRDCAAWKPPQQLGAMTADPDTAAAALYSGDLEQIRRAGANREAGPILATSAACTDCAGEGLIDVKLEYLTADSQGKVQRKSIAHATWPRDAMPHLQAAFSADPPPPPDAPPAQPPTT